MIGYQPAPPHFSWIWKSSCQSKQKFFFWLLLQDRLNTRNLLGRKNCQLPSYLCAVAEYNHEETLAHLCWSCPFAQECWDFICPSRTRNISVFEAFQDLKDKLNVPFFMEISILAAWGIWIVRNNKKFKQQRSRFASWKAIYFQEL